MALCKWAPALAAQSGSATLAPMNTGPPSPPGHAGAPDNEARSAADLATVTSELARLSEAGVPVRHCLGNHDLAVPRPRLLASLGLPPLPAGSSGYFSAPLAEGWRLVVLDTTEVSVYGSPKVGGAPCSCALCCR